MGAHARTRWHYLQPFCFPRSCFILARTHAYGLNRGACAIQTHLILWRACTKPQNPKQFRLDWRKHSSDRISFLIQHVGRLANITIANLHVTEIRILQRAGTHAFSIVIITSTICFLARTHAYGVNRGACAIRTHLIFWRACTHHKSVETSARLAHASTLSSSDRISF